MKSAICCAEKLNFLENTARLQGYVNVYKSAETQMFFASWHYSADYQICFGTCSIEWFLKSRFGLKSHFGCLKFSTAVVQLVSICGHLWRKALEKRLLVSLVLHYPYSAGRRSWRWRFGCWTTILSFICLDPFSTAHFVRAYYKIPDFELGTWSAKNRFCSLKTLHSCKLFCSWILC